MAGPWRHPKSGIYYFRKATPTRLKVQRARLIELGVKYKGMIEWSLGTRALKEAEKLYAFKKSEAEALFSSWEYALKEGKSALNHKNTIALVGYASMKLLQNYENEPNDYPLPSQVFLEFAIGFGLKLSNTFSFYMGDEVSDFLKEISTFSSIELKRYIGDQKSKAQSSSRKVIFDCTEVALQIHASNLVGDELEREVKKRGLILDDASKNKIENELRVFASKALSSLSDRMEGNYSKPEWVSNLPEFDTVTKPINMLSFGEVIEEQKQRSTKKLKNNQKAPATFKKHVIASRQLSEFRNSDNIITLEAKEVDAWRDHLLNQVRNNRKTTYNKMMDIKTLIGWAIKQSNGELFNGDNPLKFINPPEPDKSDSGKKTYSREQMVIILKASRLESEPEFRWVPWILAHTGMRVSEVQQLVGNDILEKNGRYFIDIKVNENRTTKTHSARLVPIHKDLEAEGFVDFALQNKKGRLFSTENLGQKVSRWIDRIKSPIDGPWPTAPTHGFRHAFEDLMLTRVTERTAKYITGRAIQSSAKEYGRGSDLSTDLVFEIDKIPGYQTDFFN